MLRAQYIRLTRSARLKRLLPNDWEIAMLIAIAVVCVAVGLGFENNKLIPTNPALTAHYTAEPTEHLAFLSNWDGPIYLDIAQHGYIDKSQANFFPLYPLLAHAVGWVVRSPLYSGLLVSWTAFTGAIYFYIKLVKRLFAPKDSIEAIRAALLFVLFPTGIFLVGTYTEGLFICLALGAVYFALAKRRLPTALLAAGTTATHATGIFVILLIALLMLEQKERLGKIVAVVCAGMSGLLAYMLFLQVRFHDALAFVGAQQNHSGLQLGPGHLLSLLVSRNVVFIILLAVAATYWWRRRKSFAAYTLLYICILFISTQGLSGYGRYTLAAFPLMLMLYGYFRNRPFGYAAILALSAIGWAYFALQYMGGYSGG